jgi:hypothetical protein
LTDRDVNEIADAPPGLVQERVELAIKQQQEKDDKPDAGAAKGATVAGTVVRKAPKLSIASVQRDGKVRIEETDDFEQLKK